MNNTITRSTASEEWRMDWPMVLASSIGLSLHSVSSYSLGLVMEPLSAEFGWSRAQISHASLVPAILMILCSPFVGAMIDRWGTRRLAIPSLAFTGISIAMISLVDGSITYWIALWFFYGLVSLGTKITVWTAAISNSFDSARGLALGLTICGGAITQVLVPPLTQVLVDNHGWRMAYVGLGLGWATPPFILAIFFLRDARDRQRLAVKAGRPDISAKPLTGLTAGEALRNPPLIRIALSTLLTMFIGTAILIHQVPILTSAGIERDEAALLASLAGIAALIGKITTGWMTDRWDAGLVGTILLLAPAPAYWLIPTDGRKMIAVLIGMIIIGYTAGAKIQISAYLTGQFAGLRNFGKIFGVDRYRRWPGFNRCRGCLRLFRQLRTDTGGGHNSQLRLQWTHFQVGSLPGMDRRQYSGKACFRPRRLGLWEIFQFYRHGF